MTNGRFTPFRILVAMAAAALLFVGVSPAASSDNDLLPQDERSTASSDEATSRAIIPGFYPVSARMTGVPTGLELQPGNGFLWSALAFSNTIEIHDHAGGLIDSFGSPGSGDGQFSTPAAIAISGGEAFIADNGNARVQVFDTDGTHLRNISTGAMTGPCGVEILDDKVFVADGNVDQVFVFSLNGSLLDSFNGSDSGTPFLIDCPVDVLSSYGGELYVADRGNDRVAVFDTAGAWQRSVAVPGDPTAIDVDNNGGIWVVHNTGDLVENYANDGTFIGRFDTPGSALGEVDSLLSIVTDPSGSTFWVAGQFNARIQVFTELDCFGMPLTHVGTSFSDVFDGTSAVQVVNLAKGFDTFNGLGGDDLICGGSGVDELRGGGGNDMITGGNGSDVLLGGSGNDEIDGRQGADDIDGNGGSDILNGGNGFDDVNGGGGDDEVGGSKGNDLLVGGAGSDELNGGQGIDDVRGGGGNDEVNGQNGDDRLTGGTGIDVCRGGMGTDTANSCETTIGVP